MTRYRNNNLSKTLKDYAVPFIWLLLILFLLYSIFSGEDTSKIDDNMASNFKEVQISLWTIDTKAYIIYENWKKVLIEDSISLQKSEKISVEYWSVDINFPFFAKMKLNEKWELLYRNDWSMILKSGDLWIESMRDIDISMKFSELSIPSWSIVNLNQNVLESTIYSIVWNILVSNLAWKSAQLESLEKLSISSKNSISSNINLDSEKREINEFFKLSPWFKLNNWDKILIKKNKENLGSNLLLEENTNLDSVENLISFETIQDETYVNTNSIDIIGRYDPLKVWKITINNIETELSPNIWTFSLKWFSLDFKINDLVIKIFNKQLNIISKEVITLYRDSSSISNTNLWNTSKTLKNFKISPNDFQIYQPTKTGKFTTQSSQVTIRWRVLNKDVANVSINGHTLRSFNGSTWRYHAFVEHWTLKKGVNNYEIKYFDKDWNIIFKEFFSIYKKFKQPLKNNKKISDELQIN